MMVSTRGRYALRVMLDLAEHGASGENIPMKDIAEREDLSLKYLEQIVPMLTKNGMIEGFHGKGGGYRLTRKPSDFTLHRRVAGSRCMYGRQYAVRTRAEM